MTRSPVRLGALITFASLGFAGVVGLIAVFHADRVSSGFGRGFGIAFLVFFVGATLVCALACLGRERATIVSLGSIASAGLALDLLVLAIWLEIEDETYGKIAGIAFAWSFFALIALGLTLAVRPVERLTRILYGGAVGATVVASLISTWLIATAGNDEVAAVGGVGLSPSALGDDELLRLLGASLVVLAALWFSTLAASRLERAAG
jgi:hypothetical protein